MGTSLQLLQNRLRVVRAIAAKWADRPHSGLSEPDMLRPDSPQQASCPQCLKNTATKLRGISRDAYVDYYRCDRCGHVWTTEKGSDRPVSDITDARPHQRH